MNLPDFDGVLRYKIVLADMLNFAEFICCELPFYFCDNIAVLPFRANILFFDEPDRFFFFLLSVIKTG